jgi:type VI secretion system protein VasD
MLTRRSIIRTSLLLSLVIALAGCFGGKAAKVAQLRAGIAAAADVNPDPGGRPSPIVVRIYQLTSSNAFETADFFAIYDNEVATLGQTLVRRHDEFELQPASKRGYDSEIDASTRYVGVIAAFRDLDNARWRSLVRLGDEKKVDLLIDLEGLTVSISKAKR